MNSLLKGSFMALTLLVAGCPEHANAQRCGGDLTYVVRNKKRAIVDAEQVGSKYKFLNKYEEPITDQAHGYTEVDSIKMLWMKTGCGMYLVEVALDYQGRMMLLRFHNIPMETNFFVDSVPFHEGTYEIDFKGEWRLKGQVLNREGLRSKEGRSLLGGAAQAGYLVSAKNWRRTSAKARRI